MINVIAHVPRRIRSSSRTGSEARVAFDTNQATGSPCEKAGLIGLASQPSLLLLIMDGCFCSLLSRFDLVIYSPDEKGALSTW